MDKHDEISKSIRRFGKNLRKARMAQKMTLETLAERADLNIRTLQRFESGDSNVLVSTLFRLQRALGCSWDELLR